MQPSQTIGQDIKTLHDWIYEQFSATDPMEVQNILDKQYYFKYCVGETIETPDQVSRKVMERQYEEYTFEPGETKVLMGGAAYIFVGGIASHYVLQTQGAEAIGNLQALVDAAFLAIIGKVQYSKHAESIGARMPVQPVKPLAEPSAPGDHNPNAVKDDEGNLPSQAEEDAFAMPTATGTAMEFTIGKDFYDTTANGRGRKNKQFISADEFAKAQALYATTNA